LLWLLGVVSTSYILLFLAVSIGMGLLLTTAALSLEELAFRRYRRSEMVRLLGYAVIENFGYHQLHDIWRTIGYFDIARGKKGWGQQKRRGFAPTADETAAV
jgi:hypothetical protein